MWAIRRTILHPPSTVGVGMDLNLNLCASIDLSDRMGFWVVLTTGEQDCVTCWTGPVQFFVCVDLFVIISLSTHFIALLLYRTIVVYIVFLKSGTEQ
mmetsp:Transcript_30498/g.30988  ORF Transcript_30498/g.30988 Transcript_30498/m.30988 type:complete len:97 (-) Transcript_30498:64-354(-)